MCWLRGRGVGGVGTWLHTPACTPLPTHCMRPPIPACTLTPSLCAHPLPAPTPPCLRLYSTHPRPPASRRCLCSRAAYACPRATRTHRASLPAPAHGPFPPITRATGAGDRDGGPASTGHVPLPVPAGGAGGAWRRLPDSSFITTAGPGRRGKARLDFKLENKPGLLRVPTPALPLCQGPGCPHPLPAQAASPLPQMGKLRHRAPLCHGAVMLVGRPRALPCPLC